MKILVTGHLGYIGCVATPMLLDEGFDVIGLDAGFYPRLTPTRPVPQVFKDVRDATVEDFRGVDAVIHLAALSNDPTSELNVAWTEQINYRATVHVARLAKEAGVRRFLFSSSCSVYGFADGLLDEDAPLNPLTEYAKTKAQAETDLLAMDDERFTVVCLRNGTAYGASPRMRLDLVVNNFVGHAMAHGTVKLMSDGSAWRPMVHIRDISSALVTMLRLPEDRIKRGVFNVGSDEAGVAHQAGQPARARVAPDRLRNVAIGVRIAVQRSEVVRRGTARGGSDAGWTEAPTAQAPAAHTRETARRHLGVRPLFLSDGPHVGVPEVCPAARSHAPNEARTRPFALDNPPTGAIIGASWAGSSAPCQAGSENGASVNPDTPLMLPKCFLSSCA